MVRKHGGKPMTTRVPERRLMRIRGRARAGSEKPVPAKVQAYLRGEPSPAIFTDNRTDGTNEERRRFGRVSLPSEIIVRRIGGFNFQVALKDISSGGCRVEMVEPCELGDPVIARLPELEPLGSRVCWGEGTITGVQFLRPIHPAVFDALLARMPLPVPTPE
jgi:hypothetical protein